MTQFLHPKYWPIWLLVGFLRLLILLPHSWLMHLGNVLGRLCYKFLHKRRYIAEVNIARCFPELSQEEQITLVKETTANVVKGFLEMPLAWWGSDKKLAKLTRLEGLELVEKYEQAGRGIIIIGMHYTTIEMAGATMRPYRKVEVTYKDQKGDLVQYLMHKYRSRSFSSQIEKNAMRTMVKNLRKGHAIWYAPDQDFGRDGAVFAPFFGIPAATITTLGKLQKMTGAKVLMFSHFRHDTENGSYYVGKMIDPFGECFSDNDIENATLMNQAIEDLIREYPSQYNWLYERFRTRPDRSEPKFYPKIKKPPTQAKH